MTANTQDDSQARHAFGVLKGIIDTVRHDLWPRIEMQSLDVFIHVAVDPRIEQRTLAARVGVSESAISRNLDKLVSEGLICRQEDPRDRRAKVYEVTDTGRRIMDRLTRRIPEFVDGSAGPTPAEDKAAAVGATPPDQT